MYICLGINENKLYIERKGKIKMNFYIGLNIDSIDPSEYNIRIDNQVIDYLYKHKVNLKIFYDIEPYDSTLLKKEDILKLVADCDTILANEIITTKDCMN